jgi:hypothetical protein
VSQTTLRTSAAFIARSRSAISSSRPSGGPSSPLAAASQFFGPSDTSSAKGMSEQITFQVALLATKALLSHASCEAPM